MDPQDSLAGPPSQLSKFSNDYSPCLRRRGLSLHNSIRGYTPARSIRGYTHLAYRPTHRHLHIHTVLDKLTDSSVNYVVNWHPGHLVLRDSKRQRDALKKLDYSRNDGPWHRGWAGEVCAPSVPLAARADQSAQGQPIPLSEAFSLNHNTQKTKMNVGAGGTLETFQTNPRICKQSKSPTLSEVTQQVHPRVRTRKPGF